MHSPPKLTWIGYSSDFILEYRPLLNAMASNQEAPQRADINIAEQLFKMT